MSFIKEFMNGVMKKFEVFETFFRDETGDKSNIDFKTRLDDIDVEDMSYLHTLHDYMVIRWDYISVLNGYLDKKKRLLVSLDGGGRQEMETILRADVEDNEEKKSNWDKVMS